MSKINLKATPEELGLLDNLADELAAKTAQIPTAAQRVFFSSFPQLLEKTVRSPLPSYWQVGQVNLHWQLFLVSRENQVFFFFIKRKNVFDNTLTTDIRMSISPSQQFPPIPATDSMTYFWSPPPFLELRPSPSLSRSVNQPTNH